jgi:DNA-binding NarL/FixJ family response regulator
LILLDIGLPKLNGIEACPRIHEVSPKSKIVFVSHQRDPDVVEHALSDGALGYVLKTDASRVLLPALEAVLHGARFVSRGVRSKFG